MSDPTLVIDRIRYRNDHLFQGPILHIIITTLRCNQRCRYCPYRSLCQRGVRAGAFEEAEDGWELEDDFGISLDFEQIAEIEY